ncbi:adenosylcobinamide-GDP ribazoletransferase [Methanonatronarchaeum sp. AMET6-2]|uniref:adenosylcobinamide-GDP ribazoletransferase n=1 Tax=Methanonatronarchaeum sp. AMET6-2 TaxID=2933293 RepID=UPI001FF2B093|nr:adenosylcobinamide-GDP ribazoletransferase [Methanonatronarchaeum sp. AMET6-2]UOY10180.1 adenosylcobinamide-GDP ribazoletransferase [Methanonatronarchaeum sp. AMET6-2]
MGFKDLLGFFTRLPVGDVSFERAAETSYLMPFVGVFIGVLFGLVGYLSFSYLSPWIAGLITLVSIYIVTGILHLDGLSDLMDAAFANVPHEDARRIMKDPNLGIGGAVSLFLLLLTGLVSIEAVGSYSPFLLFQAAVVSELSGKLSISTVLGFGESPYEGSGDRFIRGFNQKDYVFVVILSLLLGILFGWTYGFLVFIGPLVGFFFIHLGRDTIGGVNGDVMGGSNEVARILTLLVLGGLL